MRQPGFEPGAPPWQGDILPLNYCRNVFRWAQSDSN